MRRGRPPSGLEGMTKAAEITRASRPRGRRRPLCGMRRLGGRAVKAPPSTPGPRKERVQQSGRLGLRVATQGAGWPACEVVTIRLRPACAK